MRSLCLPSLRRAVIQAVRQASRSIRLFIVGRAWAWAYRVFSASPNNSKSFIYAPTSYIWATLDLPLSAFFFSFVLCICKVNTLKSSIKFDCWTQYYKHVLSLPISLFFIYLYVYLRISCVFLSNFDWAAAAALDDFCHVPLYFGGPKKEKLIYNLLVASVCTSCTRLRERAGKREWERGW